MKTSDIKTGTVYIIRSRSTRYNSTQRAVIIRTDRKFEDTTRTWDPGQGRFISTRGSQGLLAAITTRTPEQFSDVQLAGIAATVPTTPSTYKAHEVLSYFGDTKLVWLGLVSPRNVHEAAVERARIAAEQAAASARQAARRAREQELQTMSRRIDQLTGEQVLPPTVGGWGNEEIGRERVSLRMERVLDLVEKAAARASGQ